MSIAHAADSPAKRALLAGTVGGVIIASGSGTTSATINTAALVAHNGASALHFTPDAANLRVLAVPTSNLGNVYQGAAPTATQIDIRSTVASVPYNWLLILVG